MPDMDGINYDRMPIVVSGKGVEKLLAIPKLPSSTGILMGNKIVEVLKDWIGIPDWLAGLCFDTSSNTGINTGAITVIQKAFKKCLLFLACHHHTLEILATAVFDMFFVMSGPQIPFFSRFREQWALIDQTSYSTIYKDTVSCILTSDEKQWLAENHNEVVEFLQNQLKKEIQPRDDYLEFIKLALITLGEQESVGSKVKFSPPGAYHRARWMAKGIYCLKIFCFCEQIKLSMHELQALHRICLFTVTLYIKAWFNSPNSCDAPYNDLCLIQKMESFMRVDSKVATMALTKLRGHLWYLSEDLIGLALFSDHVHSEEKKAIVTGLQKPEMKKDLRRVDSKNIGSFQTMLLSDFVTKRSLNLFQALKLEQDFLNSNPETWTEHQEFITTKEKVSALHVVNDCAERAVKLATDFNLILTHDEDQCQLIFQIVEYH